MEKVGDWRRSIINHLHLVAASTPDGDVQQMLAKWDSLLNHVINKHEGHGPAFPACLHGPLQTAESKDGFIRGLFVLILLPFYPPVEEDCLKDQEMIPFPLSLLIRAAA